MQAKETLKFIEIQVDKGSDPQWENRLGYPKLFNMFVGQNNKPYITPWLSPINERFEISNIRAVLRTEFGDGAYIVVTNESILKVKNNGHVTLISLLPYNGQDVQIDENLQNQVGIVDGQNFYVYDQNNSSFTKMGDDQGFTFKSPISITVLNSIAVVLDEDTGSWALSDPNQMLTFPPLDNVAKISSALTQASSLQNRNDNLYIFGTTGIERWVPSSTNNPYLFPFSKDNTFRPEDGSIAVNGATIGFDAIYFLSSRFVPMQFSARGEILPIGNQGMAKIIESYPDKNQVQTSFYVHGDNSFFHMSFPISQKSWIYCVESRKWSNGDDHIVCSVPRTNVVCTKNGIFELTSNQSFAVSKLREWQSERIKDYQGMDINRTLLNGVEVQLIQGFIQPSPIEPQHLRLKISIDSESWLNTVPCTIGETGNRNSLTIWRCNIAAKEFTFNIQYQGKLNLTFDRVTAILK